MKKCATHEFQLGPHVRLTFVCSLYPNHRGDCSMALDADAEIMVTWPKRMVEVDE